MTLAFVPGTAPEGPRLLGRFLPPVAEGVAAHYIRRFSQPGDLILDPYGTAPAVVLEALSLERRVVVATLNPISRLILSLAVRPPTVAELRTALTRLGDAGRGPNDRLEPQITARYATRCAECESEVTADYFEWDAEANEPIEKGYVCLKCGGPRQAPTDADDREAARRHVRTGPDYHYLLGKVAGPDDADRAHAIEALEAYPARTLAAIGASFVRLDGLDTNRETQRLLAGLLLAALDSATVLGQERPKSLVTPRRYREVNFWLALEQAVGLLAGVPAPDQSVDLETLLAAKAGPAIHAFAGSVRDLAALLPPGSCRLIVTALPRPSQAFWSLSALWAAWLWGSEAAEPIRAVLRRRRYDWTWHARALERTLGAALPPVAPDGRIVGLVAEAEPGFSAAVFAAGRAVGLHVEGAALRADSGEAQIVWQPGAVVYGDTLIWDRRTPDDQAASVVPAAMTGALRLRAEPSRWSTLHFAAWQAVAQSGQATPGSDDDLVGPVNREIEAAARDASLFTRLGARDGDDVTTGLWWLTGHTLIDGRPPLADRVEAAVHRQLLAHATLDEHEAWPEVYAEFPGAETPGRGLVQACLASYAERLEAGSWRLRLEDLLDTRAGEVEWILAELRALGVRQGFDVAGTNPLEWRAGDVAEFSFAVIQSANLSQLLLGAAPPSERQRFIVLPGGRAGLAEHKLRRDPRLRAALEAGRWSLIKYRHIRRMVADADVTRATLEPTLAADPLEAAQQLSLPE